MLALAAVGFRHGHNWSLVDGLVKTGQARLAAVVEDHPDLAARAAERYAVPVYDSVGALLAEVDVEVASLAPRNNRKAEAIAALVEAGVHCFVDKPLTTTLEGLARIEAALSRRDVVCLTALPVRFFPAHWTARRLLVEGVIGEIASACAVRSHNLHPERRQPWELNLEENGGPLVDLGSHDLDYVAWCVRQPPVSVMANQALLRYRDLGDFADAAQMFVRFAGGASATIWSDWLTPEAVAGSATGMHFVGTQGALRLDEREGALWLLKAGGGWERVPAEARPPDFHADFLAAARGEPHVVTTAECLSTARVLLNGRRSAETGQAVGLF